MCMGVRLIPSKAHLVEEAEGFTALSAIKWARELKFSNITFEGDAQLIISSLNSSYCNIGWRTRAYITDAIKLISSFTSYTFSTCPRSANSVADALASKAKALTTELTVTDPRLMFLICFQKTLDV
ncbi:hypothetical protein BVC80_8569g2 [Macleaya cordata]|uniref:RNase H type-1 domain-containing protein n=1 Tax=Macleaya cordata TaxID=56857 RepID=A0A200QJ04_MACCD|nr:hypothetical protein BVC80_8569g2 [Macleaya cordata]